MNLISGERYLVDTNVLIYSVDRSSPFHSKAKDIIKSGIEKGALFVIAHQNITEFISVLTRGYGVGVKQATEDARAFASRFEVIFPLPTTIEVFFQLSNKHKKIYPFDLYLTATMLDNGVERIITGNKKDFIGLNLKEIISIEEE